MRQYPFIEGVGIQDGRGYGPYNKGYYRAGKNLWLPLGPNGEHLTADYDFRRGSNGYLSPLPPLKVLDGSFSDFKNWKLIGTLGMLIVAGTLFIRRYN